MCATIIKKTPLEAWIANKIGVERLELTGQEIEAYQLQKLRETIRMAYNRSPFYRNLLKYIAETEITCLSDLQRFPFTSAEDIMEHSLQFLCVSQDEIGRVVTLDTSGTTGKSKRIYFTPPDQELTIDFFRHGMSTLVEAGDRVMILLPCEREGSVGDLLEAALARLGVRNSSPRYRAQYSRNSEQYACGRCKFPGRDSGAGTCAGPICRHCGNSDQPKERIAEYRSCPGSHCTGA